MNRCFKVAAVLAGLVLAPAGMPPVSAAEEVQLPKEVTPAIRAACEADVRRLCVDGTPTIDKVKNCVLAKFFKLNKQCQTKLVAAGLM